MTRRPPPPSPQEAARRGWQRIDPRPWRKLTARWVHVDGWRLVHCGHPTAHYPWALYDAAGRMHCTGAAAAAGRRPHYGTAWPNMRSAFDYVDDPAPWPSGVLPRGSIAGIV